MTELSLITSRIQLLKMFHRNSSRKKNDTAKVTNLMSNQFYM